MAIIKALRFLRMFVDVGAIGPDPDGLPQFFAHLNIMTDCVIINYAVQPARKRIDQYRPRIEDQVDQFGGRAHVSAAGGAAAGRPLGCAGSGEGGSDWADRASEGDGGADDGDSD
jgi:hypothetical protein